MNRELKIKHKPKCQFDTLELKNDTLKILYEGTPYSYYIRFL